MVIICVYTHFTCLLAVSCGPLPLINVVINKKINLKSSLFFINNLNFFQENRRDTPKPGTAERTQPRRSSRRQNCSRVTFSLDLTESAYDKWLLIGSTNGLKNDTEIALFLIQQ